MTPEVLAAMAGTDAPQGVLAVVDTPAPTLDDVLAAGPRLLVLLTHVRDPGNAGTVIRGADAAGADAVLVSEASVDVHSPKVVRSTAGSLFHLPVVTGLDVAATLARLRDARHPHATRPTAPGPPCSRTPTSPVPHCWVMGNEAWGLEAAVRDACDDVVRVPIHGLAESLNLAMAATICLYASAGRRATSPPAGSLRPMAPRFRVPDDLAAHGLEFIPDGLVAAIGPDAEVRFMNGRAEQITGLAPTTSSGATCARRCRCRTSRAARGGRWPTRGRAWRTRTGHRERLLMLPAGREVLVTAKYVRAGRGEPVLAVVVGLRDAEARRRAEQESAALLTAVAHELRSPLTGVKGFSSTLLRNWDRFTDDQKRLMLETIEADADRVTRLITELLDTARINVGRLTVHAQPLELRPRLEAQVERRVAAGADRSQFVVEVADDVDVLWADPDRLEQVVANLVENAVRHGKGTVTIQARRTVHEGEPAVDLLVGDDGEGIRPAAPRARLLPLLAGRCQARHRAGALPRPRPRRGARRDGPRGGLAERRCADACHVPRPRLSPRPCSLRGARPRPRALPPCPDEPAAAHRPRPRGPRARPDLRQRRPAHRPRRHLAGPHATPRPGSSPRRRPWPSRSPARGADGCSTGSACAASSLPSLVVALVCWSIAPFVGYLPLLVLAVVAGLFVIPTFSIIRQAVIAAVPDDDRRSAIALDAAALELSFMVAAGAGGVGRLGVGRPRGCCSRPRCSASSGVSSSTSSTRRCGSRARSRPVRRGCRGGRGSGCPSSPCASGPPPSVVVLSGTDIGVVAVMREAGTPGADRGRAGAVGSGLARRRPRLRGAAPPDLGVLAARRARRRHRPDGPGAHDGRACRRWRSSPDCSAPRRSPRRSTRPAGWCRPRSGARRWAGTARS